MALKDFQDAQNFRGDDSIGWKVTSRIYCLFQAQIYFVLPAFLCVTVRAVEISSIEDAARASDLLHRHTTIFIRRCFGCDREEGAVLCGESESASDLEGSHRRHMEARRRCDSLCD